MSTPSVPDPGPVTPSTEANVRQVLEGIEEFSQAVTSVFHTPDSGKVYDGFQDTDVQVSDYSYDPYSIRDGAVLLSDCCERVSEIFGIMWAELYNDVDDWTGQSAHAFTETCNSLQDKVEAINEWLISAARQLMLISDEIQQDDEARASLFGK